MIIFKVMKLLPTKISRALCNLISLRSNIFNALEKNVYFCMSQLRALFRPFFIFSYIQLSGLYAMIHR